MKDFLMREVLNEDFLDIGMQDKDTLAPEPVHIETVRTRTSNGFSSIKIIVNNKERISFNTDSYGDKYEVVAKRVLEMFDEVCNEICVLPKG